MLLHEKKMERQKNDLPASLHPENIMDKQSPVVKRKTNRKSN